MHRDAAADVWDRARRFVTFEDIESIVRDNPALLAGVNVKAGKVTNAAVAETFGLECVPAV